MMKRKRKHKWLTRKEAVGLLFMSPFIIGFTMLFLRPLLQSLIYSFNEVSIAKEGVAYDFIGLANYQRALFGDGKFIRTLLPVIGKYLLEVAVIVLFSIFMAILLSQKFAGCLFFRTACFLPVIFAAEKVLWYLEENGISGDLGEVSNGISAVSQSGTVFIYKIIEHFGMGAEVTDFLLEHVNGIFDVATDSGVSIVLFIIGLQAIPSYLYEVCDIEGATKWETFWKITFPMLSPTILLCLVYNLIVRFNSNNEIVQLINKEKFAKLGYSSAQTWLYSILIIILVVIVYRVVSKRVVYLE